MRTPDPEKTGRIFLVNSLRTQGRWYVVRATRGGAEYYLGDVANVADAAARTVGWIAVPVAKLAKIFWHKD